LAHQRAYRARSPPGWSPRHYAAINRRVRAAFEPLDYFFAIKNRPAQYRHPSHRTAKNHRCLGITRWHTARSHARAA